jgi:GTP-binding protein
MEIPGLVEGAHLGVGLGHRFLQHAERVRLVWHLVDGSQQDIEHQLKMLNSELRSYSDSLEQKPQLVVINKIDIPEAREQAERMSRESARLGFKVYPISAGTGEGLQKLLDDSQVALTEMGPVNIAVDGQDSEMVNLVRSLRPESVYRVDDGYRVYSDRLSRIAQMVNIRDLRVVDQIFNEMVRVGLDKKMEELGVQPGDRVRIGRADLEWR